MRKIRIVGLQLSNIGSTIFMFIINMMASIGLINNTKPGELSDKLPNLFVPSGLTFSIWGIIYLLLFLFIIYQARSLVMREIPDPPFIRKIGGYFVLSNIANICWIFAWHYELVPLSLVFMIILFLSLLTIYLRMGIGLQGGIKKLRERLFYQVPFSVYLGWITVATIANVTTLLVWIGVDPFTRSAIIWTWIVIIVAASISILILWTRRDIAYSLVIIWALIGIIIKRMDPSYFKELSVAVIAGISTIAILIMIILTITKRTRIR